jgi:hypothetical protein
MAVSQLVSKLMYTMEYIRVRRVSDNTLLRYIKHRFWCSRIEKDMYTESLDFVEGIVQLIQEKW